MQRRIELQQLVDEGAQKAFRISESLPLLLQNHIITCRLNPFSIFQSSKQVPSGPALTLPRVTTLMCTPCASRWIQSHRNAGLCSTTLPLAQLSKEMPRSFGHEVTALVMPVVNGYNLESLGFRRHRKLAAS